MNERAAISGRLIFGLVLLTAGALWTLDNLDVVDADNVLQWWGAVPLGWGLLCAFGVGCPRRLSLGLFWIVVGAVSLLHTAGLVSFSVFELWPLALVYFGATIVFRSWSGERADTPGGIVEGGDRIRTFALMSGNEHRVTSGAFRGGSVDAMMGGVTLDMRSATLDQGRAALDVFTMWGGVEIIVPVGWRVHSEVTPIMGGYEDSTAPPMESNAPELQVRGFVVMGGIEVKNARDGETAGGMHRSRSTVVGVKVGDGHSAKEGRFGGAGGSAAHAESGKTATPVDPE